MCSCPLLFSWMNMHVTVYLGGCFSVSNCFCVLKWTENKSWQDLFPDVRRKRSRTTCWETTSTAKCHLFMCLFVLSDWVQGEGVTKCCDTQLSLHPSSSWTQIKQAWRCNTALIFEVGPDRSLISWWFGDEWGDVTEWDAHRRTGDEVESGFIPPGSQSADQGVGQATLQDAWNHTLRGAQLHTVTKAWVKSDAWSENTQNKHTPVDDAALQTPGERRSGRTGPAGEKTVFMWYNYPYEGARSRRLRVRQWHRNASADCAHTHMSYGANLCTISTSADQESGGPLESRRSCASVTRWCLADYNLRPWHCFGLLLTHWGDGRSNPGRSWRFHNKHLSHTEELWSMFGRLVNEGVS